MYYLVVDLEATCTNDFSFRENMETIEIGSVLCDSKFNIVKEFTTFIKPNKFPILSDYCKNLTTIKQEDIDKAPNFPCAMETFKEEMIHNIPKPEIKRKFIDLGDFTPVQEILFCSWGNFDKFQLMKDCKYWGIPYDLPRHINLKHEFSIVQGLNKKKQLGMKRALEKCGIKLEGTHHRGIDDARNISKLLPYIFSDKRIKSPYKISK